MDSERAARSRGRVAKVAAQQSLAAGRKRKDMEDDGTVEIVNRITREEAAYVQSSRIAATAAMRAASCCDCTTQSCSVDGHYMRYLLGKYHRREQRKLQQDLLQQQDQQPEQWQQEQNAAAGHPAAPSEAEVSAAAPPAAAAAPARAAAAAAAAAEADAEVTSAAEPRLDRPTLLRLSGFKPHYDRLEQEMAAIHATIGELHNSGFANADAAAAQQAKQELAVAQGALKAKHDAYRVLQRVFSAWLSTVLSTDEVFEVFRTWVGQACNCTACQTQRAAAAAARAAAGDAAPEQAAAPPGGALFGGL